MPVLLLVVSAGARQAHRAVTLEHSLSQSALGSWCQTVMVQVGRTGGADDTEIKSLSIGSNAAILDFSIIVMKVACNTQVH
jgi:hypothetical protein